jgi:CHC2 zinc finger
MPARGDAGSSELNSIIQKIDFRSVVTETHSIGADKTICPFHQDSSPSCHIYDDGFKCYACGTHGDALDWLERVHGWSKADAIKELERRAGTPIAQTVKPVSRPKATSKLCDSLPLDPKSYAAFVGRVELLKKIPLSLLNRGFLLEDLWNLGIVAIGEDALIPILNPKGEIVRIKRRHYKGTQRYSYTTSGTGTPAWCSPNFSEHDTVLICEGELNGMITWCVCPEISVMGVAGTSGCLWLEALANKAVYVYADGDTVGQQARDRWAASTYDIGAKSVKLLEPLPNSLDFCDVTGQQGRDALRELLSCLL